MSRLLNWATRLPPSVRHRLTRLPGATALRLHLEKRPALPGPAPGELRAVVYLPTWATWDSMRQRPQYLMAAFARLGHPAYFVDHRAARPRHEDGVAIVPDLSHCPAEGVILYVHFAPLQPLFSRFAEPVVVYDILDDLSIFDADEIGMPEERRVRTHHPTVMSEADIVMASSPDLVERHRAERDDLLLVVNGVDPERFGTAAPRPADLPPPDPGLPLVGYHGAVAQWLDYRLIAEVAAALPDWRFAFVGPVDPRAAEDAARLDALPNVTLLGERPSDEMPAYAQAFDIGAVWFAVDHMTRAVAPLKMYEYLAAGTPVVSTPLPVAEAEPLVRTAADAAGFVAALERARADAADPAFAAAARSEAAGFSWEARLRPVLGALSGAGRLRVPA